MSGGDLRSLVGEALSAAGIRFKRLSLLDLVRGEPGGETRAVLAFVDGSSEPTALVKLAGPARAGALATEYANLRRLEACGPPLSTAVPRALYLETTEGGGKAPGATYGNFGVMVQTALLGARMKDLPPTRYFASAEFTRHLGAVSDFLAELHGSRIAVAEAAPDARAEIERYRSGFATTARLDALLEESAASLGRAVLPTAPCHGDFCTANLLLAEDGGIRVIDWEHPLTPTWPLADLHHFTASVWTVPPGRGAEAREASYRTLLTGSSDSAVRVHRAVWNFAARLGIADDLLRPLAVLAWVTFANRKRASLEPVLPGPRIPDDLAEEHLPLVVVRGGGCRNLELLAELPAAWAELS